LFIAGPRRLLGRGRAPVALAANFQLGRTRLAQALHGQPQPPVRDLGVEPAAHGVPFRGPQMQQAFVVLPGDRILGSLVVKNHCTILERHRTRGLAEELLDCAAERFWGHTWDSPQLPPRCL